MKEQLIEILNGLVNYIEDITYTNEDGSRYNTYIDCTDLREYGDEKILEKAKKLIDELEEEPQCGGPQEACCIPGCPECGTK